MTKKNNTLITCLILLILVPVISYQASEVSLEQTIEEANRLLGIGKFPGVENLLEAALLKFKTPEEQKKIKIMLADNYFFWAYILTGKKKDEEAIGYYLKAYEIDKIYRPQDAAKDLHNLGAAYKEANHHDKAIETFERALTICKECNFKAGEEIVLKQLGELTRMLHRYGETLKYYNRLLQIFSERDDLKNQEIAINNIGWVYDSLARYEVALKFYHQALAINRELGDRSGEATVLNNIGESLEFQGQYKKALEYYKESYEINRSIGDQMGVANSLNKTGVIYYMLSQYSRAKECFEKSLALSRLLGLPAEEISALNNLGEFYRSLNKYDEAKRLFEQALEICREIKDIELESKTLNNLGGVYNSMDQYEEARNLYEQALHISRETGDIHGQITTLNNLGGIYHSLSQYDKAESYFNKALRGSREIGDPRMESNSLNNLGKVYVALSQYERAVDYFKKSLEIAQKIGTLSGTAITLKNLGEVYRLRSRYNKAISYYQQAVEINRKAGNRKLEAESLGGLGSIYLDIGRYNEAFEVFKRSLAISREIGDLAGEGTALNDIGLFYSSINRNDEAIEYYNRSLEINRKLGDRAGEANILNSIGSLYSSLGQHIKAIKFCEHSLKISRDIGIRSKEGIVLNNLAIAHSGIGNHEKALEYYAQALKICEEIGGKYEESGILCNIGFEYNSLGQYDRAVDNYKKAIKISITLGAIEVESRTRINLAHSLMNTGKELEAIDEFEKALAIRNNIRFELKEETFKLAFYKEYSDAYINLVFLYIKNKQYKKAYKTAAQAKSVVFSEMMTKRWARKEIALNNPGFRTLLDKENNLFNRINKLKTTILKKTVKKDREQEQAKQENIGLKNLYEELSRVQAEMKEKFPRYAELLYPRIIEMSAMAKILKEDETYISFFCMEIFTAAFIITKRSYAFVKLDVGKEWFGRKALVLRNKISRAISAVKRSCKNDMNRFHRDFSIYGKYPQMANELYLKLFKPLEQYIWTKKLIISADGAFYGFPIEALVTKLPEMFVYKGAEYSMEKLVLEEISGRAPLFYEYSQMEYLGEKYSISYIPTASTLNILRGESTVRRKTGEVEGLIAFADPIFSKNQVNENDIKRKQVKAKVKGLIEGELYVKRQALRKWPPDRLPETGEEAEVFKNQIGIGKVYKGLEATEENVWQAGLEKAKYVLFSTHGILGKEADSKDITEPALVLTLVNNPDEYDGLLGMTEAAGLRLNSDVVILSACSSTGVSGKGGEGFVGMARSFLFAGSQAVVASHWPVETRATKMLIENYGKFLKTRGRLEALEAARKVVKNAVVEYSDKRKINVSYAHPYFWAPFVLLGER